MDKIVCVKPEENYRLFIELSDGSKGIFDVSPYLDHGIFSELKDKNYFMQVRPAFGGVVWPHDQDFSGDTIAYEMKHIA